MKVEKWQLTSMLIIMCNLFLMGQQTLSGTITDAGNKEPLIGAAVIIKGTTIGSITDIDGKFKVEHNVSYPLNLEISFLGYETKEILIESSKNLNIELLPASKNINEVVVTARRRSEEIQDVPIAISVLSAKEIDNAIAFNVNRIKELVPSIQLYSSNPRNTTINIRGLGSTFGLTNDGIDPGVGFYVDGVYYARPAATTMDFIDIQQIDVLRGPQGTLFGKNTTAGTFNITTKKPTFSTTANFELSFGNFGFIQTKGSISGPIIKDKLAARISFSGTHRNGNIYNVATEKYTNTLNNQGFRAQLLYQATEKLQFLLSGDFTRQRPDGYAQVFAGVAPTLRPEFRQFESIIADLGYNLPSRNAFDRKIDHDTPWRSDQDMGGVSLNADVKLKKGTLTSTSAWRTWVWGPSNDRDFTGLQSLALSQAPSIHHQISQELRYAGELSKKLSGVAGAFFFYQKLDPDGAYTEESGKDQWRFVQNTNDTLWETLGLLDGYGIRTYPKFRNISSALFAQLDWKILPNLTLLSGVRVNYDYKKVNFKREVYGGLQTSDPALVALQRRVYSPQEFQASISNWNASGTISLAYSINKNVRLFGTYSLAFKPVGLNLGGLPTDNGRVMTELASIKPERINHYELGLKSEPFDNAILNLTLFNSEIKNYQTNVSVAELGVNRGYLANAEKVRVFGAELDLSYTFNKFFKFNTAFCFTEGRYVSFTNAPVPLEETGGENFKDISGELLPGISRYALSGGLEFFTKAKILGQEGEVFIGGDSYYRSSFSSSSSASKYLNIDGYALVNARLGFRANKGVTVFLWSKNLANTNYFEQLLPASGNAGHFAGVLGDPRTYGITLRYNFF